MTWPHEQRRGRPPCMTASQPGYGWAGRQCANAQRQDRPNGVAQRRGPRGAAGAAASQPVPDGYVHSHVHIRIQAYWPMNPGRSGFLNSGFGILNHQEITLVNQSELQLNKNPELPRLMTKQACMNSTFNRFKRDESDGSRRRSIMTCMT